MYAWKPLIQGVNDDYWTFYYRCFNYYCCMLFSVELEERMKPKKAIEHLNAIKGSGTYLGELDDEALQLGIEALKACEGCPYQKDGLCDHPYIGAEKVEEV